MKPSVSLFLLLLVSLTYSEGLQLFSVSKSQTQVIPPSGSVSGGTTIYIKGLGFSTNAADNQVFIGSYPCTIPADGATSTSLACITSDTQQYSNINYLPIIVTSNGIQRMLTNEQGSFSYLASSTPQVVSLYPASAIPGSYIRFYGYHRITNLGDGLRDMGDVISMIIGTTLCGRFDLIEGPISANSLDTISCHQANLQEAGKYLVKEYLTPGYSMANTFLRRASLLNEHYHFAVLPAIQSVSPNSGALSGQRIIVTGAGFTTIAANVQVDVNGTTCDVVSTTLNQIVCDVRQKNIVEHSILNTNSGNQINGYTSGTGLKYQRYDINSLGTKTPEGLRNAISTNSASITLVESGYRGQVQTGDYHGAYYGQAFTGYFTAPADGQYTFQGVADDSFNVYLSTNYGSVEPASTPLIYSNTNQPDNFYLNYRASAQANVTLIQGKSYYIQVYHINLAGTGFLRVNVQIPNSNSLLKWQTHTVHKLEMSFTNDPQIVHFNQTGGNQGQINLTVISRVIGKPPTVEYAVIEHNATIGSFLTALKQFTIFASYDITGTMETYTANGTLTTNTSEVYTYLWIITIPKLRPTASSSTQFTTLFINYNGTQLFTQTVVHPHGPLIGGTFELSIGGNSVASGTNAALSAGISANSLQNAFRSLPGFSNVQVSIISNSKWQAYGATWIITYLDVNQFLPQLTLNFAGLTGGATGTTPQMVTSTLRYYSSDILLDPIDFTVLRTPSDAPNVLVTINNIPSVCNGTCKYTFLTNTPVLQTATISSSVVSLSLNDPATIGYTLNDVTISIGGQACSIIDTNVAISNFQCQLPINADNSPTVPAGSYMPQATISQIGQVGSLPAVVAFDFPLTLTSLNFTTGTSNGGYTLKLIGTGFPLTLSGATIRICNIDATIISINNIQAEIYVPQCTTGIQNIAISDSTRTSNSLQFTYTVLTPSGFIYTVTPQSHNPSLKGIMNITGTGFGTDMTAIRVDLANGSGKVYPMRVLNLNDSYIRVGIPGGLTGKYKVEVNLVGLGQIMPNTTTVNDFAYQLIISSIYPSSGSNYGGTLVHIQGVNFAPALDQTRVYIGNQINWLCNIETLTTTDIFCRTPIASQYYNISVPQTVYMESRLMVGNTCTNPTNCQFTYLPTNSSPSLSGISTNSITTGTVTLTGNMQNFSSPSIVLTNKVTGTTTVVSSDSFNSSTVTFTVPSVESGQYNTKVRIDPVGQTNAYLLQIKASITGIFPSVLSTNGGIVTISGHGLPVSWPNSIFILSVTAGTTFVQAVVVGADPSALVISLPAAVDGTTYSISLTPPVGSSQSTSVSVQTVNTPMLTLTTSSLNTPGINTLTFTKVNLIPNDPAYVQVYSTFNLSQIYNVTLTGSGANTIQFNADLPGGIFGFRFYYVTHGYATCSNTVSITITKPTIPNLQTSYNGGTFTLTGAGLSPSGTINVGGFKTTLSQVTASSAVATIAPLAHSLTQSQYTLSTPSKLTNNQFTVISDTPTNKQKAFDSLHGTSYTSSSPTCYIGIDVGSQLVLKLTRIRFFPHSQWLIVADYLIGATIEGSTDGTNYVTLATVDSTVHTGWNIHPFTLTNYYRYFRIAHTSVSQCQFAEIQFQGILYSQLMITSLTSNFANAVYQDGANTFTFANAVEFRQDRTPLVNSLSIPNGDVFGGYNLTLNGVNLNYATPAITIDGQICSVLISSSNQIVCNVSQRFTLPTKNTFLVTVGNMNAIIYKNFEYVLRWSDIRTWGTDMPPIAGDLVYVPQGMNLLVDQSTPQLEGILVTNGTLTFADQGPMTINTGFITLTGGRFIAGTEQAPYQNDLTFVMYGGYYGPQAPIFGNKGIGCLECFLSMHGKIRSHTWSELASTITPNTNTLTVTDVVDWQVGELIVVASTSFDHNQAQNRTITAISGSTITVDRPFNYQHFSGIQTYGNSQLVMKAEVGLLSRNIKMMGDTTSVGQTYGSHLLMAGSAENGLVGHIAYSEFTDCGQPRIIGRYCIHFHMNGDVHASYARGNSVHQSMARVITLHGVHYLTVEYNVGYQVSGHNYFIQDGIQTHNLLQYNLAISSLQAWTMLQTDISVASFWVTNPSNSFRYNRAAGSDFYGFWYEIKPHPDGPSANGDVCPMGNPLGQVHNNTAHSNKRFGLRIFKLTPRTYPCRDIFTRDDNTPWQWNPAIIGTFSDFTLYKNGQCGLLAQQTGNLIFKNFITAQNKRAGAQFYVSQFTETPIQFRDSIIVGLSQGNSHSSGSGIITPKLGNIRIDNIGFFNFPSGTHSLSTCSNCDDPMAFSNTGQEIYISNITFTNITGNKLYMAGVKREVLYDLDGTFTTTQFDGTQRTSAAVTYNYKHLANDPACLPTTNTALWHDTLACDQTVKVVLVAISALTPSNNFNLIPMKIQEINDVYATISQNSTTFTQVYSIFPGTTKDSKHNSLTYSVPYISGRMYNIWWFTGLDFDHLQVTSSPYLNQTDDGVLFKFNYTLQRQAFDIGVDKVSSPIGWNQFFYPTPYPLDYTNCTNGEYFHDDSIGNRTMQLCTSGRNRSTYFQVAQVNSIYCRYLCPAPPGTFIKQDFVRYWSNVSQWPQGRLPVDGEDVYVSGNWTIIMDIDPAVCGLLTIDGDVIIEDKQNRNVTCKYIWIKAGSITAGSATQPFMHQLTFQLNGLKNDSGFTFDIALQGSKIFVVTGRLNLYGNSPTILTTKLTQSAFPGDTTFKVGASSGWTIGDTLVLSPSFNSGTQYQRVTITAINSNTITFTPALQYTHYGALSVTISNSIGELDTRATVGHITRSIKFVSGPDSGWGYTVWVYQMWQGLVSRTGAVTLDSVQFTMGGQYDTEKSSLNLFNNGDTSSGTSIIRKSSFSYCRSYCLYAFGHNGATIQNNVFFEGRKFHMKLQQINSFTVNNNLMIGAIIRPTLGSRQAIACLQLTSTNPSTSTLAINNNICQGSQVNGFVLPLVACSQMANMPFNNNTAGSIQSNGFLLPEATSDTCLGFSGVRAYACNVAQVANPAGVVTLMYSDYILADNKLSVTLRFGLGGTDRTAYLSNSYITAVSRPTCTECYSNSKTKCNNIQAVRLLAVTINGEHYPKVFDSFDGLCKQQVLDSKSYFNNVTFQNYRTTYNQTALASCGNNYLFRPNGNAPDLIGSVYIWTSVCNYCDFDAMGRFDAPKASEIGWFGGCGNILCTGRNNYIIQDYTGTLFNQSGVILANNSWIGGNTPECTFHPTINGYFCTIHEFAILQYESIAPDYKTRIMWPVSLKYDGGNWQTITNGYKQWQWAGSQPLNQRIGRFISTTRLFQHYNMTFASNPPDDLRLMLQKRIPGGNNSDWIVVRIYYPFPNMVQVQQNGIVKRPISLLDNNGQAALNTAQCGSNKFFYFNRTIEFVITGASDCLIRISLTNSVQLTLHFAMPIADFYTNNGQTRIIDRVCAIFNIQDQSRVKIVSVYTGSTKVTVMINSPVTPEGQSYTANNAQGLTDAINMKSQIDANIDLLGSQLALDSIGPLISADSTLIPMQPQQTSAPQEQNNRTLVIIVVCVTVGVAILIAIFLTIYLMKRSSRVVQELPASSDQAFDQGSSKHKQIKVENITEENISQLVMG